MWDIELLKYQRFFQHYAVTVYEGKFNVDNHHQANLDSGMNAYRNNIWQNTRDVLYIALRGTQNNVTYKRNNRKSVFLSKIHRIKA